MFKFKKRAKSGKKIAPKSGNKKDGNSDKHCKGKTMTNTAGWNGEASDRRLQDQYEQGLNSVEQYIITETISKHDLKSVTSCTTSDSTGEISCGENVNRRTYSLEEVSRSLDQVMASGKAILDALASVNSQSNEGNTVLDISGSPSLTKRGTYDLDKVSELLDSSVGYRRSSESNDISQNSVQRRTYDLETVSTTLDQSFEQESSLEEILYNLGTEGDNSNTSGRKRGTYDLGKIESTIDDSLNSVESTQELSKRGTYDLTDVSIELNQSVDSAKRPDHDCKSYIVPEQSDSSKRATYNLSGVSDLLDNSVRTGRTIDDSLDKVASSNVVELKHGTYKFGDSDLALSGQAKNETKSNNTMNSNEQKIHTKSVDHRVSHNSEEIPGDISNHTSEKPNMSTARSFGDNYGTDDTMPVNGLLSDLGLDKEDGVREVELTPKQWMEQMKELGAPPPTFSPLKLKLSSKKVTKGNSEASLNLVTTKLRSQTVTDVSSENSKTDPEAESRSLTDLSARPQLKSSSTPNFSTSTPIAKSSSLSESLEDISPGIRNYLSNKLGLSEQQCVAVHRRLSNDSETAVDTSKLANRKTYSLDDVAHSLDIATSQGLPMTKVLDNLDGSAETPQNNDVSDSDWKQKSASMEQEDNVSMPENKDSNITKPALLDLNSNTLDLKLSADQKMYVVGAAVNESPVNKLHTTSLDNQFKLVRKKAVYKPSTKLHSFSHLLGSKGGQTLLRKTRGSMDPLKRNTYTLESVAESLEKAQEAGVPMLDALKRLSGSCQAETLELSDENRRTYNLEDVSKSLETATAKGVSIVDTLRNIAEPEENQSTAESEVLIPAKVNSKKKAPPKPKRTFSNSSKPAIKFVSDSFVIEYFTSPKKSQSIDSEQSGQTAENIYENHNLSNQTVAWEQQQQTEENYYENESNVDVLDNNIKEKLPSEFKNTEKQEKPSTKVVNDLNNLLVQLAAEVQKPSNTESSTVDATLPLIQDLPTEDSVKARAVHEKDTKWFKNEELLSKIDTLQPSDEKDTEEKATENGKKSNHDFSINMQSGIPEFPCEKREARNEILVNPFMLVSEEIESGTKLDDEGYCSLSRKPCLKTLNGKEGREGENQLGSSVDLCKKEKNVISDEEIPVIRSYDKDGESQEFEIFFAAEDTNDEMPADSSDSPSQADPVSRELNLLRLRLAEKQRDIEAQKKRTREQLEEERKRLGQNVFWLAVGKGRDVKELSETNSPKKSERQTNMEQRQSSIADSTNRLEPPSKVTTMINRLSPDDLPPSMGKLQDRTFSLKTNNNKFKLDGFASVSEEEGSLLTASKEKNIGKHSVQAQSHSIKDRYFALRDQNILVDDGRFSGDVWNVLATNSIPSVNDQKPSVADSKASVEYRAMSDDIVQFRHANVADNFVSESQNSQKPVLNYKSRINVPSSFQTKNISEKKPANSTNPATSESFGSQGIIETSSRNADNLATSPQRKCWNTETNEPCIAVSESNHDVFKENGSERQVTESRSYVREDSEGEMHTSLVDGVHETPKKGLALFIGQEISVCNDGLTPEQLKKREKFLRNRQQKIEEDKLKKEALLEKKRRKEEKMKEIQLRREQEEQTRQTSLREKREQAEQAKQERQKYEMRRKENLQRTNFIDGSHGANAGYHRTTSRDNTGYKAVRSQGSERISGSKDGDMRTVVKMPTSAGTTLELHEASHSATPSAFSGFTGVQSYVKPSGKTNRKLIINAICYVCLPGAVNKDTKEKCLQAMTESSAQHFLILFKEGFKFRSLYSLDLESLQVLKIYGVGPRSVTEKMIEQLYKYNSGGKEFSKIPAKGFSLSVDGFTLKKSCWQSNKPPVPSKTISNLRQSRLSR